ncbi:MAG TPA: hypothetical protein VHZ78_09040 [Rhizomicrobium sp.]|jgi:hypothetical protein|nr:hypothetical protein [Rhizomicrobium sp.]
MRMKNAAAALGLVTALCGATSAANTWKDYAYWPQHFAISFPAPPTTIRENGSFLAHDEKGTADLTAVAACGLAPGLTPEQIVSNGIANSRMNGTIRDLADVAAGPVEGKAMVVDRVDGTTVRQRIFSRKGCLYVIFGTIVKGHDEKRVTLFLDSFKLLSPLEGG